MPFRSWRNGIFFRKNRVGFGHLVLYFCTEIKIMIDYQRIASAITYIRDHSEEQPSLDNIAAHVHLSPFHFQRLFKEWAGVSPKKFLQYISVQHARHLLQKNYTMADISFETGLSGTGRLHDLFISIEAMTPGEFRNGGELLSIGYTFSETVFGNILIAATSKGVCKIDFIQDRLSAVSDLKRIWPNATLKENKNTHQQSVINFFMQDWSDLPQIKLHLKGTSFQLKVWEALLKIPSGALSTYSSVARLVDTPKAFRATGTAIGDNPIAYLIPCHRVIRSTGIIGEYHWGSTRKISMIGWEQSQLLGEPA
jgi:AraC family transcriptional regulator, regulatory protein of adaptative response / methylated-DNA-[protein]-cysteine methyltransferase